MRPALILLTFATQAQAQEIQTFPIVPPAQAPELTPDPVADRARAVQCMAAAIAYEAAREPIEGQQAVAEVILNRVRDPAFPKSICGVVYAGSTRRTGCQFSFTCDGSLVHRMSFTTMETARTVAEAALDGRNPIRVFGATSYHADYVAPYWAPSLVRIGQIGAHIFYRNPGAADVPVNAVPFVPRGETAPATSDKPGGAPAPKASLPSPGFLPWGLSLAPTAPGAN
jgi:spore germination cell wall hydrolase CwlJ-like protein